MATLPPVPYGAQMLEKSGFISSAWQGFFRQLVAQLGGSTGNSIPTITAEIATLETQMTAAQAAIEGLQASSAGAFNQGRYL